MIDFISYIKLVENMKHGRPTKHGRNGVKRVEDRVCVRGEQRLTNTLIPSGMKQMITIGSHVPFDFPWYCVG